MENLLHSEGDCSIALDDVYFVSLFASSFDRAESAAHHGPRNFQDQCRSKAR